MTIILGLVITLVCLLGGTSQSPADTVKRLLDSPQFAAASAFFEKDHDRFVRELITLTEIAAPPFKEKRRAEAVLALLRQQQLAEVEMDAEGNVMALRKGSGTGEMVAVLAHMDTVFPEGTHVKVRRSGDTLSAPGVGDNTRGVAPEILRDARATRLIRRRQTVDELLALEEV